MLKVKNINSGAEFYQPPYVSLEKNSTGKFIVKGVGAEAKNLVGTANIDVTNPFAHHDYLFPIFKKPKKS